MIQRSQARTDWIFCHFVRIDSAPNGVRSTYQWEIKALGRRSISLTVRHRVYSYERLVKRSRCVAGCFSLAETRQEKNVKFESHFGPGGRRSLAFRRLTVQQTILDYIMHAAGNEESWPIDHKLRLNLIQFGGSWGTDDNPKKTAFSSLLLGADDRYQSASVWHENRGHILW